MAKSKRPDNVKFVKVRSNKEFTYLILKLMREHKNEWIGYDLETTGAKDYFSTVVGGALSTRDKDGSITCYYIPINHKRISNVTFTLLPPPSTPEEAKADKHISPITYEKELVENQVDEYLFTRGISALADSKDHILIGHNIKYDLVKLLYLQSKHNLLGKKYIRCKTLDTQAAAYLLHYGYNGGSLKLKERVKHDIGYVYGKTLDDLNDGDHTKNDLIPIEEMCDYCCDDVWVLFPLLDFYYSRFGSSRVHKNKRYVFEKIECPTIPVLACLEHTGVIVDPQKIESANISFSYELEEIDKKLLSILGKENDTEFNLNSTQQLSQLLFDDLKWFIPLDTYERGSSGYYSTATNVLNDLVFYADTNLAGKGLEVCELLLERSSLSQLIKTYTRSMPGKIDKDGRLRCNFNQFVTITNRLSASGPNLQNIPSRTERGKRIRKAFIAKTGWIFGSADYSQMEKRIEAYLSQDPMLLKIFKENLDIHTITAEGAGFIDKFGPEKGRNYGKTLNYQVSYGAGIKAISEALRLSYRQTKKFYDKYFETYAGTVDYKNKIKRQVETYGFTSSLSGNTRNYFRELKNDIYWFTAACNHPMQTTSADVMKMGMRRFYDWSVEKGYLFNRLNMLLVVHDELDYECEPRIEGEVSDAVKYCLESVNILVPNEQYPEGVDLPATVITGPNWAACH